MADEEAATEARAFDTSVLNDFLKEKEVVEGIIEAIVGATDTTLHLVDEAAASFDPAKEAEISQNLVRVSKQASTNAKKAKVPHVACLYVLRFG